MVDPSQASSPVTGAGLSSESMFQGFGVMRSYSYYFNQMEVFVSSPLVERTIKELDFEVSYYSVGNVKTIEQYKNAPFDVVWDKNHPQLLNVSFSVKLLENGNLIIEAEDENKVVYDYSKAKTISWIPKVSVIQEVQAGTPIESEHYSFTIVLNRRFNPHLENPWNMLSLDNPAPVTGEEAWLGSTIIVEVI